MRTEVATNRIRVTPGTPSILEIGVTNTSDVIDGVTAVVTGLDPEWVHLAIPVISLFPESSATLSFRILVPTTCLAGEYPVTVEVISLVDPDRRSMHECWVSVEPVQAASMELRPSLVIAGKTAKFDVVLTNEGNVATDLAVTALDETRALSCLAEPSAVTIPASETRAVALHARGPRPWFGNSVTRTIKVESRNSELELEATATFTQKPRIPRGFLTLLILVGIIALWATIFLVLIEALRTTNDPAKASGTLLVAGPGAAGAGGADVDLSVVGASMTGNVTAVNNQAPVPRITVEAYRLRRGGVLELTGSAATDEDGVFSFEAVLPGTYKIRFSGDGFDEQWHPGAASQSGAEEVRLDPGGARDALDAQLVGKLGRFQGEVVAPESPGGAPQITVSVVEVVENPVEGFVPQQIPTVTTDRTFDIGNLRTPGTYRFTVTSPGFEDRTFDETLGPGQTKVINTVTLGAAPISLAGTVRSAGGQSLGNVKVTLRSGELLKETTTPTSGDGIGQYLFEELETPGTYVLTFELDGYTSQTISLALEPGPDRVRDITLFGGAGELSGRAVDTLGTPLGGVEVTVREGDFTAVTSTLTDGAGAAAGTFAIRDLPTPGAYTVTFALAGYESETVLVLLGDGASQGNIDAVMTRSTGRVSGVVSVGGTAKGDITVELSSGGDPRTTISATSPAGRFEFDNVEPGSYTLTFRRTGLLPRIALVTVAAGQDAIRSIDLPVSP